MARLREVPGTTIPPKDRLYLVFAAIGLAAVMASLAAGSVIGLYQGDFWAQAASVRDADAVRQGVVAATGAWNPFLLFFGVSMLMATVVVVLRRIVNTIRARGEAMVTFLPSLLTPEGSK